MIAAHDAGRVLNPVLFRGQITGSVHMGLGYALSEEMLYEDGQLITPSFSEYLIPTSMDMPEVESIIPDIWS